jgi:hypothetical protein
LATALRIGRKFRPCGELAYHVLDVMLSVEQASKSGRHVDITSTCERPAAIPAGLANTQLD